MGSLKPWQLILVILGVLVLGFSLWKSLFSGSRVEFGDRVYMVDVLSGELFYADTSGRHGVVVPAKNPDTGIRSIIPVLMTEEGEIALSFRYRDIAVQIAENEDAAISDAINKSTWAVDVDPKSATRYSR